MFSYNYVPNNNNQSRKTVISSYIKHLTNIMCLQHQRNTYMYIVDVMSSVVVS